MNDVALISDFDAFTRVLLLQDYNTRVVVFGTALLGLAAGVVGTFMLLRKRALIGDALSHATLPGIGIAFAIMVTLGGSGKFLPGLLLGAIISGLLGIGAILLIRSISRLKEDAAMGIVLSTFFGLGIAIMGVLQQTAQANVAGLDSFIYGKTASMIRADALAIGGMALLVIGVCAALYKEFAVLSFDNAFAAAQGWPIRILDVVMMVLVTAVTVIGLQAVGLILMVALLVTPAAAARFWAQRLPTMLLTAAIIGAVSGWVGAGLSALMNDLPAGAIIVLVSAAIFLFSVLFGIRGGLLVRVLQQSRLNHRVGQQHLLRALYEFEEIQHNTNVVNRNMELSQLLHSRSWSLRRLRRLIRSARRAKVVMMTNDVVALTDRGRDEAARVVRNHRLWELYLITHADIAPSHVDRDADQIEHVLDAAMITQLEHLLVAQPMPASPHALNWGQPPVSSQKKVNAPHSRGQP